MNYIVVHTQHRSPEAPGPAANPGDPARMLRSAGLTALLTLLGACSEDSPAALESAPLSEVCGAAGPFQLLPLAPDERVGSDYRTFAVIGDRLLFVAGKGQRNPPGYEPLPETSTVYAVGPCGENPVVVAHDIQYVYEEPLWPGVALGCTIKGHDLVRLDPSGAVAPVLLANSACFATVTKHGLLNYTYTDDHRSSAEFFPLIDPAGPLFGVPISVADPVPVLNALTGAIRLLPDEVLLLEADGDLVSFALPDLPKTLLQPGVVTFVASDDARYLLYQLSPSTGDDPYNPIGTIHIRDRSNGISVPVGTGQLGRGYPDFFGADVVRVTLTVPTEHERLISLPDFEFLDAPEGHELDARLPDGRWLSSSDSSGPWFVLDLEAGSTRLVSANKGKLQAYTDGHIDVLIGRYVEPQSTLPLVRFFFDDREPQTIASRANRHAVVREDGRILTMVDVDDAWLGELTLVDPSTREARRIDDRVVAVNSLDGWVHPTEPDTIVYSVVDGDRTGVWLARPAPID